MKGLESLLDLKRIPLVVAVVMTALLGVSLTSLIYAAPSPVIKNAQSEAVTYNSPTLNAFGELNIGKGSFSESWATQAAQEYPVIVVQPGRLGNGGSSDIQQWLSVAKAANSSLKIIGYYEAGFNKLQNGSGVPGYSCDYYTYGDTSDLNTCLSNPSNCNSTNKYCNPITCKNTIDCGGYLMSPTSSGWQNSYSSQCQQFYSEGFNGCYPDSLGLDGVSSDVSQPPINPAKDQPYQDSDWIAATSNFVGAVHKAVPGALLVPNGIQDGQTYSKVSSGLLSSATWGGHVEDFLRTKIASLSGFKNVADWYLNMAMITGITQTQGQKAFITTKLFTTASCEQIAQWYTYSLATFLLANNSNAYYNFAYATSTIGPVAQQLITNEYNCDGVTSNISLSSNVNIGSSDGSCQEVGVSGACKSNGPSCSNTGSIYYRKFSDGLALVNPTTCSLTFALPGSYTVVNGAYTSFDDGSKVISGTQTIPADTGLILSSVSPVSHSGGGGTGGGGTSSGGGSSSGKGSSSTPSGSAGTTKTNASNTITTSNNGQVTVTTPTVTIQPAANLNGVKYVNYYLNNKLIYTAKNPPYTLKLDTHNLLNGTYTLTTVVYYLNGKISKSTQKITVKNPSSWTQAYLFFRAYLIIPTIIVLGGILLFLIYGLYKDFRQNSDSGHYPDVLSTPPVVVA